jgi:predicted CXXCH cytochrome family protein
MRRYALFLTLLIIIQAAGIDAAPTKVQDSKHNLSTSGTGTVKSASGGTSEICVFCHTPHSAKSDAPLWNRNMSAASYTVYTSDVLGALSITAESPAGGAGVDVHVKTRICLSCHDGTIALGSLVNLPYGFTAAIPMQSSSSVDAQGKLLPAAQGYIGTELRDDHPVAIPHDRDKDPELTLSIGSADRPNVNLYRLNGGVVEKVRTAGASNYVECTSCHSPHDNQYGNFLVETNQYAALCGDCHSKTQFASSVHDDAAISLSYSPPTGGTPSVIGTVVGEVKCMNCHFPHKAGVADSDKTTPVPEQGKYLLSFTEEQSCFNANLDRWGTSGSAAVCHGSGAAGLNSVRRNIQSLVNETSGKPYKHGVGDSTMSGRHQATEGRDQSTGLAKYNWTNSGSLWHVECDDCHNSHTAKSSNHLKGANGVGSSSPLYGSGGARATAYPGWAPASTGTYAYIEPIGVLRTSGTDFGVSYEYEICFKCHTDFAWGSVPPVSPSFSPAANMTNQAVEFNPANASYHSVVQSNPTRFQPANTSFVNSWTANSLMYCSDCHTQEYTSLTPQGPHGSTKPFILLASFTDTYGTVGGQAQPANELCGQCHSDSVYLTQGNHVVVPSTETGFRDINSYNLHSQHAFASAQLGKRAYRCVNCHSRVPHGFKNKALIVFRNDGAPYEAGGSGTGFIPSTALPSPGSYTINSCSSNTANSVTGCHP